MDRKTETIGLGLGVALLGLAGVFYLFVSTDPGIDPRLATEEGVPPQLGVYDEDGGVVPVRIAIPVKDTAAKTPSPVPAPEPAIAEPSTPPDQGVTGLVLDANGDPVPGARVAFHSQDRSYRATTGPDGAFFSPELPAGSYQVQASTPSAADFTRVQVLAASRVDRVLVLEPAVRIEGQLLDAIGQRPPGGLEVRARLDTSRGDARAEADAEGRFSLLLPPCTEPTLSVRASAGGPWQPAQVQEPLIPAWASSPIRASVIVPPIAAPTVPPLGVQPAPAKAEAVPETEPRPATRITHRLRVRWKDGSPVRGARILRMLSRHPHSARRWSEGVTFSPLAVTDREGNAVLELAPALSGHGVGVLHPLTSDFRTHLLPGFQPADSSLGLIELEPGPYFVEGRADRPGRIIRQSASQAERVQGCTVAEEEGRYVFPVRTPVLAEASAWSDTPFRHLRAITGPENAEAVPPGSMDLWPADGGNLRIRKLGRGLSFVLLSSVERGPRGDPRTLYRLPSLDAQPHLLLLEAVAPGEYEILTRPPGEPGRTVVVRSGEETRVELP